MPEVRFYHLTHSPLEITLPGILDKSLQRGWRVLLQCGAQDRLDFLDDRLWSAKPDSFLPHGKAVGDNAAKQPVLLTMQDENLNDANVLMLVDGASTTPGRMAGFELACLFFDGNDPAALDAARRDWKAVSAAKLQAVYWAQDDDGRWIKKAESGGAG
ncbi:MAG: DNA polymerase III subunit chi [Rhodobacteraceae bacterium]|nr:DNA polymerase III subunit chi [Paracoccaceae bacterium]